MLKSAEIMRRSRSSNAKKHRNHATPAKALRNVYAWCEKGKKLKGWERIAYKMQRNAA